MYYITLSLLKKKGTEMRRREITPILIALLLIPIMVTASNACSTFVFSEGTHRVFGKNYDWGVDDGLIFINKRDVTKTIPAGEPALTWTSKYGSITFNQYGREFANGGMNEAGLVVEVMWLAETQYPTPDDRFGIDCLQWVQYQLDNSATVGEVIASDAKIRISNGGPLHYMVCDRTGGCATIEFLKGKMVVHIADELPIPVLTNDTYENSIVFLKQCKGFGGTRPIENSPSPLDRFARAANLLRNASSKDPVTYAFDVLENVSQVELTKWSIVYDMYAGKIFYRTFANPKIRSVDFAAFDFDCISPAKMIDVNGKGNGDISPQFQQYSQTANRNLIGNTFSKTEYLKDTPSSVLDSIATYPDVNTHCRKQ